MDEAVLVYDGTCGYCSTVAKIAAIGGIRTLPYESKEAQQLLDVFDDKGFTLYLFDGETVHWGSKAAEAVASHLHMPGILVRSVGKLYPYLLALVSFLTRRGREVSGPSCSCAVTVSEQGSGGTLRLEDAPGAGE
ncbi:MAG: hypothetical protein SV186_05375 [Candidatus Nanohaloarchaea archaeon]|nr:hypothetical protein [Candidatus Nanohaloarchaea archaeon]